jgi:hypothetical protein
MKFRLKPLFPQFTMSITAADPRSTALSSYKKKLLEHREIESKLKESKSRSPNPGQCDLQCAAWRRITIKPRMI